MFTVWKSLYITQMCVCSSNIKDWLGEVRVCFDCVQAAVEQCLFVVVTAEYDYVFIYIVLPQICEKYFYALTIVTFTQAAATLLFGICNILILPLHILRFDNLLYFAFLNDLPPFVLHNNFFF